MRHGRAVRGVWAGALALLLGAQAQAAEIIITIPDEQLELLVVLGCSTTGFFCAEQSTLAEKVQHLAEKCISRVPWLRESDPVNAWNLTITVREQP